ncbi:MAG: tRNA preQ1(34) S-adenosylmethionine ribosyltransferase-isomerase QueA [Candidatus Latescibacteria bacterium]|nr:tRNA preQ1(34) S-adenosylmethionine ribosyltransferase-isomerase QueA [Candidatus Latescibacterota bacterium]
MNLADYDYNLPAELIAQKPLEVRDESRLMVLPADNDSVIHRNFYNLTDYIESGDCIVRNDTRVFPARLIGTKEKTGGEVEIFLLNPNVDRTWNALSRPAKRLRIGSRVIFNKGLVIAEIIEKGADGHVRIRLESEIDIQEAIDKTGKTPLPPYIKRETTETDRTRYQTVYAQKRGAVAAPTAGLHFSKNLLDKLVSIGAKIASITLHVGIGTFRPLNEDEAQKNVLHNEYCEVPSETVYSIEECRQQGKRVIVVGTTTARALETASTSGSIKPFTGWTNIFIKPPYRFKSVDALITNFHLPRSSLLLMVSAFAGKERILDAYEIAVQYKYRFYSYGDAMLIFGRKI